jgi:hypothetical protein
MKGDPKKPIPGAGPRTDSDASEVKSLIKEAERLKELLEKLEISM